LNAKLLNVINVKIIFIILVVIAICFLVAIGNYDLGANLAG
jgi:hypothetical protein